jgi:NTP pyrophosphatase (non-canonical NTP hydrolase)
VAVTVQAVWIPSSVYSAIQRELAEAIKRHPTYTSDPLRRAALVAEEAGEALQEALDLTRASLPREQFAPTRERLKNELTHTAAMAVKALIAMREEDEHGNE